MKLNEEKMLNHWRYHGHPRLEISIVQSSETCFEASCNLNTEHFATKEAALRWIQECAENAK